MNFDPWEELNDRIDWPSRIAWFVIAACMVIMAFSLGWMFTLSTAYAQDGTYNHGHAENHDWYRDLKQPNSGMSCCSGDAKTGDCRPTRAYLADDGEWRALIDGVWTRIPPKTVLKQLAPDGNSHICASPQGYIYCFLGGSPKS
jgi:hypothetical protein